MKMKFVKESSDQDPKEITIETDLVTIDQILDDFTYFLRACGFVIDYDSELQIVKNEENGD